MQTIIIKTDTATNAKFLAAFLKKVSIIKSVVIDNKATKTRDAKKSDEEYNWINPSRPATNEEFEQMIVEAMKGKAVPSETSRKRTLEKFEEWLQKNSK